MEAESHLSKDPIMRKLIQAHGPVTLKKHTNYFMLLSQSIIAQQISNAAANAVTKRFKELVGEKADPKKIVVLSDEELRSVGLSRQKVSYIKSLAEKFLDRTITPRKFNKMTNEEIIAELIQVKGIGRWTAQMFLIFSLGREDVFAYDDLGLRNKIYKLYFNGEKVSKHDLLAITEKWKPYRSIASLYLWASTDDAKNSPW